MNLFLCIESAVAQELALELTCDHDCPAGALFFSVFDSAASCSIAFSSWMLVGIDLYFNMQDFEIDRSYSTSHKVA